MAITLDANLGSTGTVGPATTVALTTSAAAAANTRIILVVQWFSSTTTLSSVSGGSLTWVVDRQGVSDSGENVAVASADAPSGLASSTSITATLSASVDGKQIAAASFLELATGSSGYLSGTPPAPVIAFGGTAWTSPSITTADTDCLIFGGAGNDADTPQSSTPSSGTEIHDQHTAGTTATLVTQYRVVSGIAGYTVAGTWAVAGTEHRKFTVAYKAGAGAGATPTLAREDHSRFPKPKLRGH